MGGQKKVNAVSDRKVRGSPCLDGSELPRRQKGDPHNTRQVVIMPWLTVVYKPICINARMHGHAHTQIHSTTTAVNCCITIAVAKILTQTY